MDVPPQSDDTSVVKASASSSGSNSSVTPSLSSGSVVRDLKNLEGNSMGGTSALKSSDTKVAAISSTKVGSSKKKMSFCANLNCINMISSDKAVDAPSFARSYFGMSKSTKVLKICLDCFKKAEEFQKKSRSILKNNGNLFDLTLETQTCDVVDLDGPGNSSNVSDTENDLRKEQDDKDIMYSVSLDLFNYEMERTTNKFNIQQQMDRCTSTVASEFEKLVPKYSEMEREINELTAQLESTKKLFNETIAKQSKVVEIEAVHIDSDGGVHVEKTD